MMFADRREVHNNTMVKKYNILVLGTHTLHIYCHVKMYQCYKSIKKTVIILTHIIYTLNMC